MKTQELTLTTEGLERKAAMLKAMAHPMRLHIINLLYSNDELPVNAIHEQLDIEQAVASHHLSVLKNKGLLISRREGKSTFYALKFDKVYQVVECISACKE